MSPGRHGGPGLIPLYRRVNIEKCQNMNNQKINMIFRALLASFVLLFSGNPVFTQGMGRVFVKFSNPQFDHSTRHYSLDVELRAGESHQFLFGMNVRFFFDASELEFLGFDGFHAGYGNLGAAPVARTGTPDSGLELFAFPSAASFVNSAVQLRDESTPMELYSTRWVKAFSVNFRVPGSVEAAQFCPSIIWDMKAVPGAGGILRGSDGLVATLLDQDPASRQVSRPSLAEGIPFNWQYDASPGLPYGAPEEVDCISLNGVLSSNNTGAAGAAGYELLQNHPNPFSDETVIQFLLPEAMNARVSFYSITGKRIKVIEGSYPAGLSSLKLDPAGWMGQSGIILYRLETDEYTSEMRKMTLAVK